MIEALGFDFMQNAVIGGLLVSFVAGIMGALIVVNRMVFLAGGIAHSSYGGIGMAIYFGFSIFLGAMLFSIATAILIALLTLKNRHRVDTYIGLIWAVGMAIGVIFVDLTPGYNVDLMSYLFGSILAVSQDDIYIMFALLIVVLFVVSHWYREILSISYDSEYASLRGINTSLFYIVILSLSAMSVVVSIKVVGLILVIAIMTIPTFIAEQITKSLYGMMMVSGVLASIFTLVGLAISYNYDLTSGACIILVAVSSLLLFSFAKYIFQKR